MTDSNTSKVSMLANSNNRFTFALFKEMTTKTPGNIIFSPFSINVALSMTFAGAKGTTADEMRETLKIEDLSNDDFHSSFNELLEPILQNENLNVMFHIANRMYVHNRFHIQDAFKNLLQEHYLTTAALVDFAEQAEAVRLEINGWVEDQTKKKIQNVIAPGILDTMTRLVLVNAVYFKGDWKNKFNAAITNPADFYLDLNKTITVDMMFQRGRFPYAWSQDLDCSVLELAYVNDKFSMLLVLPNEIEGLVELEDKLDASNLQQLIASMQTVQIVVRLPKFCINGEMRLSDVLSKLGMTSLFSQTADLSGITGQRDLHVSAVLHKAFLEVNEDGSEAAAATVLAINKKRASAGSEFIVNHPFLLMIRNVVSGIILFMGRVSDPSKL